MLGGFFLNVYGLFQAVISAPPVAHQYCDRLRHTISLETHDSQEHLGLASHSCETDEIHGVRIKKWQCHVKAFVVKKKEKKDSKI